MIFISDHGQIPTLNDDQHKLGTDDEHSPFGLVAKSGFRVRRPLLTFADLDKDYQAVLAYQGFMAYVYLADRSTCSKRARSLRLGQATPFPRGRDAGGLGVLRGESHRRPDPKA